VEVEAAPLCGVLSGVAVKDGEEALAADAGEIVDERVRVLHRAPLALVFMDADLEPRAILERDLVQFLQRARSVSSVACTAARSRTPYVSAPFVVVVGWVTASPSFEAVWGGSISGGARSRWEVKEREAVAVEEQTLREP
jgi:hypothetical protein